MIAPDLRGHGDSDLAPDGFYDIAAFAIDLYALVHDVLGHEHLLRRRRRRRRPVVYDLSPALPRLRAEALLLQHPRAGAP